MDALKALNPTAEETLDPDDWTEVQALSYQIVDDAVELSARCARPPGLAGYAP